MSEDVIHTEPSGMLLDVGDILALPEQGMLGKVVRVDEIGVRIEFIEWLTGGPDSEQVWSWDRIFNTPDLLVYGDGYYRSGAADEVHRATDRRLKAREAEAEERAAKEHNAVRGFTTKSQ